MSDHRIHHVHDKGYKALYSNKTVFLDLLQNMLKLEWARDVTPNDLSMMDKSFVTNDYSEVESDLIYRLKIGGEEAIVYVLLEMQSTVDYRMPIRLLEYITEILREYAKEANFSKGDTKVHIPAVFPVVLYNGEEPWKAKLSLREVTDEGRRFGESILNFRYSLLDVNHTYTEEDLLSNDCVTSIILLLDQNVEGPVMLQRLGEIVQRFKSLTEGQNREIISHWVGKTANPLVSGEMVKILHMNREEVPKMVSNLATAWQRDIDRAEEKAHRKGLQEGHQEGLQKGFQQKEIEMIKSMAEQGADLDFIARVAKMTVEEVEKILQ